MVLSKSEILNGASNYEEYTIKALDDTVCLRPLTIGEIQKIEETRSKALGDYTANQKGVPSKKRIKATLEAQAKINVEKSTIADNKADIKIVVFGLDNKGNPEKFTEEDVKNFSKPTFEEILSKVKEISHMEDEMEDLEDDVEDFH